MDTPAGCRTLTAADPQHTLNDQPSQVERSEPKSTATGRSTTGTDADGTNVTPPSSGSATRLARNSVPELAHAPAAKPLPSPIFSRSPAGLSSTFTSRSRLLIYSAPLLQHEPSWRLHSYIHQNPTVLRHTEIYKTLSAQRRATGNQALRCLAPLPGSHAASIPTLVLH